MDSRRVSFTLYRVFAYAAGIWLLLLMFVAMPAKYLVGEQALLPLAPAPEGMEHWFGPDSVLMLPIAVPHGYIYLAYVIVVLWLSIDRRWGVGKTVGTMLAGTIPVLGLVVEHRLAAQEKAAAREPQPEEEREAV